jgi:hypothetical protein
MTRSRDLANLADGTEFTAADHTKLDGIETSADVTDTTNVVAALTAGDNITIAANGTIAGAAQYTHPNHSGEVTSTADGATVIVDDIVDEANLKVSNTPTNGYFLSAQSGNTGGMTWAEVAQPSASDTLNTIKTVDGTGSGLDADLLDGQEGAYYAPIGSPTLTGTPAAPTASAGANSTQISTTAYVDSAISALADSAPAALNTLNELAAALGDDANYAATTTTAIGTKLAKAGGQMTGNITMAGTETVDGRDLSVDGTKLDTIEASATADQTAAQLLTAIKTVDGASSGLNADLLDGYDSTSFLRSDASDSASGTINFTNSYNAFGNSTGSVSNSGGWNARVNVAGSGHARIDVQSVSDGIITSLYSHTGQGAGRVGTSSNHPLIIMSNSGESARFDQSGNLTLGGTVDGRDVAADGTKLDTIATSANNYSFPYTVSSSAGNSTVVQRHSSGYIFANYFNTTPNTVTSGVTQVCVESANDGYIRHGSAAAIRSFIGFAANTSYLRSDTADSASGAITFNGGISIEGNVIWNGTDTWCRIPGATGVYFSTYAGGIYQTDSTYVRIYNSKSLQVDSNIRASGNITAYYSDERLKNKTGNIENALEKVESLSGFTYVENELAKSLGYKNEKEQVALSAQDVQKVLPQAVSLAPCDMEVGEFDGVVTSKSGENYLTVDYSRLVPLLVEAIKELKAEVEELKK